jgi:hypothetical protein
LIAAMRLVSSCTFLRAAPINEAIFSRSTTITPSPSPITKSPARTVTPPTVTGWPMRPPMLFVGPLGLVPTEKTG